MKHLLLMTMAAAMLSFPAKGQYSTPSIDGNIAANEYGTHSSGQNQESNGGQTWYMTWDASNLYIAITNANLSEAAVVYLDYTCLSPVNGGSNSEGTLLGQNYDGTSFAELQFRADFVCYVKNTYREYRTANGSNGWSGQTSGFGSYAENSGSSTREFSIPWAAMGGIPACFNWFGYLTSGGGSVYGELPAENGSGFIGTTARYERYYTVSATTNGAATKPFSRNSYVFNQTGNQSGFGGIAVYDFTMNDAGLSITRGTGAWSIAGNLVVNEGLLDFGATASGAAVVGNLSIGTGGTLTLSTALNGDMSIGGNFTQNGSFNCNNREVTFNGSSLQTLSGNFTSSNKFDYLRVNGSGITLGAAVDIEDRLDFDAGLVTVNNTNLTIYSSGSILDAGTSQYIATVGSGYLVRNSVGNTSTVFPVGTASSYNPATLINAGTADNYLVRVQSSFVQNPTNTTLAVQRQWIINEAVNGGSNLAIGLQWNASEEGLNFSSAGDVVIGRHNGTAYIETSAGVSGANPYTASAAGFTSLSPFAIGMRNALPVELTRFDASAEETAIILIWATATEQENAYFDIERSVEGRNWASIGTIAGHGTSFETQIYRFVDKNPLPGVNYYRLRQVDFDGQWALSPIVSAKIDQKFRLQYFPSPANNWVTFSWGQVLDENLLLWVMNVSGQALSKIKIEAGQDRMDWQTSHLAPGIYWLALKDQEGHTLALAKLFKTGE